MSDRDDDTASDFETGKDERIAKYLASAGVASRRDVERMIGEGRISVDGRVLDTPAFKVTGREDIRVDGARISKPGKTRLWRFHKPAGLVTTNRDPEDRPTVFGVLPPELPRVVTVGRLDLNTEGLLLLTNDGELARALELPSTGIHRRYRARAFGRVQQAELDRLRDGIVHEGIEYRSIIATLERQVGSNSWIEMTLVEGKKREARRALESLGLRVSRLIRVAYGPVELGDLPPGAVAELTAAELLAEFSEFISAERRPDPSARMRGRDSRPAKATGRGAGKAVDGGTSGRPPGPQGKAAPKAAKRQTSARPGAKPRPAGGKTRTNVRFQTKMDRDAINQPARSGASQSDRAGKTNKRFPARAEDVRRRFDRENPLDKPAAEERVGPDGPAKPGRSGPSKTRPGSSKRPSRPAPRRGRPAPRS